MKKTRFEITIQTDKMTKIVPEEYIGDMDKCPKNEELTDEVESTIHQHYFDLVKNLIEDNDKVFEEMENTGHDDVLGCEGIDTLEDFGNIKVSIRKIK